MQVGQGRRELPVEEPERASEFSHKTGSAAAVTQQLQPKVSPAAPLRSGPGVEGLVGFGLQLQRLACKLLSHPKVLKREQGQSETVKQVESKKSLFVRADIKRIHPPGWSPR